MRLRGWTQAMRGAGPSPDDSLVAYASSPMQDGYAATLELLRRPRPPTAVFTASNFMTIGALRALRELNIVLPRDLSLVAFDDFDLLSLYDPPVTAVAQPVRQLGREAGKLLLAPHARRRRQAATAAPCDRAHHSRLERAAIARPPPATPALCAAEGPKTPSLPFRTLTPAYDSDSDLICPSNPAPRASGSTRAARRRRATTTTGTRAVRAPGRANFDIRHARARRPPPLPGGFLSNSPGQCFVVHSGI